MIAFEYRPTVSLAEGVDAIQDWQRLKLQKAMAKIQLGSQFMDKSALAQGFSELGLNDMAKRYQEEDAITKQLGQAQKEAGTEVAKAAALEEYFKNRQSGYDTAVGAALKQFYSDNEGRQDYYYSLAEQGAKGNIKPTKYETVIPENAPEDVKKQVEKNNAKVGETGKTRQDLINEGKQAALKEYFSSIKKPTDKYGGGYYYSLASDEKIAAGYKDELAAQIAKESSVSGIPKEQLEGKIKEAALTKLPDKVLQNPENIEKIIYSAPNGVEARTRMTKLLAEMINRKGGLDVSDLAIFQDIDRGLYTLYGQDYKPMDFSKYLKIQGRGGGSGSGVGGKDYVVIDEEGRVVASTAAANQAEAIKQYAKKGSYAAVQGTFEDVVNMTKGFVDNAVSKGYGLEMAGIKIDKGFMNLGSPKFVDTETGEEITLEEVYRRVLKSMVGAHKRPEEQNVQVQGKTVSYQQPTIPKGNKLDKEQSLEIFKKSQKPKKW